MDTVEKAVPCKMPELDNLEVVDRVKFQEFLTAIQGLGYWVYQGGRHLAIMRRVEGKRGPESVTVARILECGR